MTKTTLKALWFGGGGVIATWLAVTPNQRVPAAAPVAGVALPMEVNQLRAEELSAQADRLRDRVNAVAMRPATRNPFRFNAAKAPALDQSISAPPPSAIPPFMAVAQTPALKLDGITEKQTPTGVSRTAVISGEGQIYLVREGETVAGRLTVVAIDPEAVLLRDSSGTDLRLALSSR